MSVPARIGTCWSAIALVRQKRGSTWMTLAPRSRAFITQRKPTGCASAIEEPWIEDAVGVLEVLLEVGGAAAPERGPQTGDRGGVSYAGLVLDLDRAHRGEGLLDEVVLLVVERRAAEVGEAERAVDAPAVVVDVLPAVLAGGDRRARRSCPSPSRARAPPTPCRPGAR